MQMITFEEESVDCLNDPINRRRLRSALRFLNIKMLDSKKEHRFGKPSNGISCREPVAERIAGSKRNGEKVTNFAYSDLAGAVSKLQESVKNIERNFDSALGFETSPGSDVPSPSDTRVEQVESTVSPVKHVKDDTQNDDADSVSSPKSATSLQPAIVEEVIPLHVQSPAGEVGPAKADKKLETKMEDIVTQTDGGDPDFLQNASVNISREDIIKKDVKPSPTAAESNDDGAQQIASEQRHDFASTETSDAAEGIPVPVISDDVEPQEETKATGTAENKGVEYIDSKVSSQTIDLTERTRSGFPGNEEETVSLQKFPAVYKVDVSNRSPNLVFEEANESVSEGGASHERIVEVERSPAVTASECDNNITETKSLSAELKMMEAALQGAAKQSQMKADEITRLMGENEKLKLALDDLKAKSNDVELDALREEYQQRLGAAERKVYALTKERDMLRREQSRKNDSSILLKEKDEIIKQVMAEGEELSKKQAALEGTVKKLRAQIRELEEEKQRLSSKLQVEEGKVESIRKDKMMTEKALQDAVERGQTEVAALREYYTNALNEAKDAEAQAEARADSEAKADLERRCRESADREAALLQSLEELRQALSATEQQAAYREDMLRGDLEDLERRCQAAEARYDELLANMPDSTQPFLRQIEGLEEAAASRAELWAMQERSLNSRLQEAEAKAAAAQERERAINERLSQTLSRMAVMEAQLSCLRAEQSQLTRSLEKERQRASESRQEFLVATESAATHEGRAKQLEEAIQNLRSKHKQELKEERTRRLALEQEIEQERAVTVEYEKCLRAEDRTVAEKPTEKAAPGYNLQTSSQTESSSNNKSHKRVPSVSSAGSVEESLFLQASVDSGLDHLPSTERLSFSERPPSPYNPIRSMGMGLGIGTSTIEQLEAHLRQKEGELSSCFARLAALESTRDSLAEELVKATTQNEMYRSEANLLPGLRAELDSLRRRHTSALELMGERDEQVEELKADLADVKQMYREQITMLVGQIERLSSTTIGTR
ncbi:hypothetical protein R1flu_027657 [Riccia fluitans]|uniref:TATA element modulatory factor 1 TATA binding domain-containing protein n=1 Tax=Riccia fluitans TaxID=41844 RepID=A0ABD1XJF6_9MARC